MARAFLDSNILIGLVFRHSGERAACEAILPPNEPIVCSRYVIFEVARGFLLSLVALHNYSFEFKSFADLHLAAYSGQLRFKPYKMHTWLGAFTDYFAVLESEDGVSNDALKLDEFRAKLRGWIRRGWRRMHADFTVINEIGCRDDLAAPAVRGDQRINQNLPTKECGNPAACRVQSFIQTLKPQVEAIIDGLEALPTSSKDKETINRIDGLKHLLSSPTGTKFQGSKCYRCGDALICLETPVDHTIATKNRKHFEPIANVLGKPFVVAISATSTTDVSGP